MESIGIQTRRFNPYKPMLSVIMNDRDHRKILVVDGRVAHTGGYNIADEYINKKSGLDTGRMPVSVWRESV